MTTECPASAVTWHALYLTEFFNRSLERAAYIGDSIPDGLPIRRVDVATRRRAGDATDEPLLADYVVTQPGIELDGDELGRGTAANLVLWRTDGPVRVVGATLERRPADGRLQLDGAHASQVAARVEGDEELLALAVDLERIRVREKGLDRLERARAGGPCGSGRCSSPRR